MFFITCCNDIAIIFTILDYNFVSCITNNTTNSMFSLNFAIVYTIFKFYIICIAYNTTSLASTFYTTFIFTICYFNTVVCITSNTTNFTITCNCCLVFTVIYNTFCSSKYTTCCTIFRCSIDTTSNSTVNYFTI